MSASQTVSKVANSVDWSGILSNVGSHLNDWINTLAHSLGVAANFLMQMEIKQMYIYGLRYALFAALVSIAIVAFYKLMKASWKQHLAHRNERYYDSGWAFVVALLVALMIAYSVIDVFVITEAVGHFVNPAHYALNDIINQINTLRSGGTH